MAELADHFGENAELDDDVASHIADYLERNTPDKEKRSDMSKMLRNLHTEKRKLINKMT